MRLKCGFFFLIAGLFFFGCTNKSREKSQVFDTPAGEVSISIISTQHYDAGLTGAPHAPIVIPYLDKKIFNAVQLSLKGSDTLIVDDLAELTDLLSKDQIDSILGQISVSSSPDGKNIVYQRKKTNGNVLMIVHRLDDSTLFYSGIYEKKYQESIDAKKMFDWKTVPSVNEIAKQVLLDTVPDEIRDALFETVLINQKHPSELDNFAMDNFGGTNLASAYIQFLASDSFWKNSNPEWKNKVRNRIDFLAQTIEKTGRNFDSSSVGPKILESLVSLERQSNSIQIINQVDSLICRMSFVSVNAACVLLNRQTGMIDINPVPGNPREAFTPELENYYHKLALEKINLKETRIALVIKVAADFQDSVLTIACAKKLLATWPEMIHDSLNPNPLTVYYGVVSPAIDALMRAKAEKYINTKYFDDVNEIFKYATCDELKALRKKYPAKFEGQRMPCDSAVIYSN
jgi:hypothetical protein